MITNPQTVEEQIVDRRIKTLDVGRNLVFLHIEDGIVSIAWDGEKLRVITCTGENMTMHSRTCLGDNT